MTSKSKILEYIKTNGHTKSSDLSKILKISRQSTAKHLRTFVERGVLLKSGSTRNAAYSLPAKKHSIKPMANKIEMTKSLKGLAEDSVYSEVESRLNLTKVLSENAEKIAFYSFGEMLNNAIDHSRSLKASITVLITGTEFQFEIKDSGIGIFENIRKSFKLQNEYEAIEHLMKGKQTTMPSKHSGEGIYFTSRIADKFVIRSHNVSLTIDNQKQDTFVKDEKFTKGTTVSFSIKKQTRKNLSILFKEYSNDNLEFDRNTVKVVLSNSDGFISRSQAKRLTNGMEKFKRITFDFKNIKEIGQGFADEVFRVFPLHNKGIELDYINAGPAVTFMIERAKK